MSRATDQAGGGSNDGLAVAAGGRQRQAAPAPLAGRAEWRCPMSSPSSGRRGRRWTRPPRISEGDRPAPMIGVASVRRIGRDVELTTLRPPRRALHGRRQKWTHEDHRGAVAHALTSRRSAHFAAPEGRPRGATPSFGGAWVDLGVDAAVRVVARHVAMSGVTPIARRRTSMAPSSCTPRVQDAIDFLVGHGSSSQPSKG